MFLTNASSSANRLRPLLACLTVVALIAVAAGCKSNSPYSASFASVEIKGKTPDEIRDATIAVFREDGYAVMPPQPPLMVFEKEGTRRNKVAYGNWVGGPPVYNRVKVSLVPLAEGVWRVQCNAYMVRNKGEGVLEDEVQLANARRIPYQDLLDQIAKKLK